MKSISKFVCINLLVLLFVVSCGGGGGGGGSPTPSEPSPTSSLSSSSSSVLIDTVVTLTWSSTNATSCTASGTWSGTKATSGTEDVTIATPGNNQFTITCSGAGGSQAASVTVEGYRNTDGVSVDGYIRQADIFIDTNDSYTADSGEDTTTSDNDGKFTIKYSDGNLISLGGTDLDSGNALDNLLIVHKLTGHSNFKAVTPVTSVAAFMADPSLVNNSLGIDASLDISTVDPVAGKGDGGINDYLYEKGNQLTVLAYALQNITNNLNATTETTQDYFKAIAEELDTEYSDTETRVNIETEAFITKVLNNIVNIKSLTLDDTNKANTISALAAILPVIQVKADSANTTAIFDFATSTLQTDAQAIANGTASAATVTSYQTDILNYVANDQNVVADELVPDISALPDSVTIDEDSSVEVSVLANDSYNTTSSIDVVLDTSPSDGSASLSNNVVSYVPDTNFFGSDEISYTITQGDKTSSSSVAISINSVNDVPTFDNLLSTYTVDENQTAVTSISASDVEDEALTISISGSDEANFNLSSSDVLTFAESPDYETQSSYSLVVSVTDGIDTLNKDLTVNLNNLNDNLPIFSSSSSFSADENQVAIGTVAATDADGDSVTFTASGSDVVINNVSGVIAFNAAPDYETKSSFTSTVTATDGLNSSTQDITIAVNNLNDNSPVLTSGTDFTVDENTSAVGTITGSDADGDTLSYSISGTDADSLFIDSASGVLAFNEATDYETKTSYSFNLIISDGVNSVTNPAIISITNLNDNSPIFTSAETFSIPENESSIGTVEATDADTDSSISYSVDNSVNQKIEVSVAANANGSGNVYVISGEQKKSLFLEVGKTYSFEHPTAHPLRFSTTADGTHGSGEAFTDGVDTSTDGVTLITVSADTPTALYYYCSIHSGMGSDATPSSSSFPAVSVDASSGVLTFSPRPDFETLASFSAKLSASDGEIVTDQDIQINITDVDPEGPIFSSAANFNIDENLITIGFIEATDPLGASVSYSISGTDASLLSLDSTSGELAFVTAADFETKSSYEAVVTASGSITSTDQDIIITINNLNDNSPIFTSSTTFTADENQTEVGSISASDADGDSISYSVSGSDLLITSEGVLSFTTAPDYETQSSYSATLIATDGVNSTSKVIDISINNLNDNAPIFTSSETFTADENQTSIGSVTATDADGDAVSFSVSGTELTINSSGLLTFTSAPDYETQSSYSATLTATDGTNSISQDISISINDVNEAPTFTSSATFTADENQTSIGSVTANDVEGNSITFTISGSELAITSVGVLTFVSAPDFETKSNYTATVTANDGVNDTTQTILISVNDINDAPTFTSSATFSAKENQTIAGTVVATDQDGDALIYTISGSDLSIGSNGEITFKSAPNYEEKDIYTASVNIGDGEFTVSQDISINITDVNDIPVITSNSVFGINENTTNIGNITVTDEDGDTIYYSIMSGSDASSISLSSSGQLTLNTAPDFESPVDANADNSYNLNIKVSDANAEIPASLVVNVNNVNDNTPTFTTSATLNADENQQAIITVDGSDPDGELNNLTYNVDGTEIVIHPSTGVMTFASPPDYETKSSYTTILKLSDGTFEKSQEITINVNNLNDNAPEFTTTLTTVAIEENDGRIGSTSTPSKLIMTVSATDADGDDLTFNIPSDSNLYAKVQIGTNTGQVKCYSDTCDYETDNSLSGNVNVFDGAFTSSQEITINFVNINDNYPQITINCIEDADTQGECVFEENSSGILATYVITDADGDTSFEVRNGSYFPVSVDESNSAISLTAVPDYEDESTSSYFPLNKKIEWNLIFTDGENQTQSPVTVTYLKNLNDNLLIMNEEYLTQTRTEQVDESIGFFYNDDDLDSRIEFCILGDNNYVINGKYGGSSNATKCRITNDRNDQMTIYLGGRLDFETNPVLNFQVEVKDFLQDTNVTYRDTSVNTQTFDFQVNVTDTNDPPIITSPNSFSIAENGSLTVGTITATDQDGDDLRYMIGSRYDGNSFNVDPSSGVITFKEAPNYEAKSSYAIWIIVADVDENGDYISSGSYHAYQDISIEVTDVNDSPTFTSNSSFNVDENQTAIGPVVVSDEDEDSLTYSVTGTNLNINSTTGALSFASAPDYETTTSYSGTVSVTDGSVSVDQSISISINNLNDNSPVFTSDTTFSADENQTSIGTVTATDADGNSLTFSSSNSELSINSSGVLAFASAPNYENKSSYTSTITVNDGANPVAQNIIVNVNDVNEAPTFTSGNSFALNNGDTSITTVTATDEDGDSLTFSISGTDASDMILNTSTGVLELSPAADWDTKSSYSINLSVTDGQLQINQAITVEVNEPPQAVSANYYLNLAPASKSVDIQLTGYAGVSGRSITYAIVTDATYGTTSLDSTSGILTYTATSTDAANESIVFKTNDGFVDSTNATISIELRTDPLYKYQWHLDNTGQTNFASNAGTAGEDLNVDTVIAEGYTGSGVIVAVLDAGLEIAHEDLIDNVQVGKSYNFLTGSADPTRTSVNGDGWNAGDHGTSVAGIIASKGWNNIGGRGVAPNAGLIGYNFLEASSNSNQVLSFGTNNARATEVDIFNLSYGVDGYDKDSESEGYGKTRFPYYIGSFDSTALVQEAYKYGTTTLRNSKGALYIKSSGNGFNDYPTNSSSCGESAGTDINGDAVAADNDGAMSCTIAAMDNQTAVPYQIVVGALNAKGIKTSYSTPGASLWVSSFGGEYGVDNNYINTSGTNLDPAILTTDQSGCSQGYASPAGGRKYNAFNDYDNPHPENPNCNYITTFNGTSSAAPNVSGAIALMLEANPALTWRDVKHILASTSRQIDVDRYYAHATGITQYEWETNAAGYTHHNWYGFGSLDTAAAVSAAKAYTAGSLGDFNDTGYIGSGSLGDSGITGSYSVLDSNLSINKGDLSGNFVEFIRVYFNLDHPNARDIGMELISPQGTRVNIVQPFTNVGTNPANYVVEIGVSAFYGEEVEGDWTLRVTEYTNDGTQGLLNFWGIKIYGH